MCQILEVWITHCWKLNFFLVRVGIYKVIYPRNFGYNINRKYEKDIGYNYDIAILYQKIKSENLGKYRYLFREVNIVTDE